jgi:DNA-directed RNA polymerase subunit RPC12/RpoP
MNVTRGQIVLRGLTNCCPNCGARTLFKAGSFFEINDVCSNCGMKINRAGDEGFYLGSLSLNYGFTLIGFLTPVALLWYFKVLPGKAAAILAGVGSIAVPALFYRSSRSWWLMNYYVLFPHHLPANGGKGRLGEDENV